jgi:anti-anti-sigma regulatory factor
VRAEGFLTDPTTAAHADHVCWIYEDADDFADVARRYLEEGLTRGERLLWIGEGDGTDLRTTTGPLADLDDLRARGVLQVLDVRAGYEGSGAFAPEEQFAFYDAATRSSIEAGYRGLRVVADVSGLAADPERRTDLVRWEHRADEYIASGSGMVALCAYRSGLGAEALADGASVHPLVRAAGGAPPFRIWFDGDTIAVAGALDTFGADRLDRVLTGSHVDGPVVTLDLSRVEFVDVGGCRTLARWARHLQDRSARLELVGSSRVFQRMWRILGFGDNAEVAFRERAA